MKTRPKKTQKLDSEPAKQVAVKRPKPGKTIKKSKETTHRRALEDEDSENKWLVQTMILMAVTLGLILILYFLQAHDLLKYLLKIPEMFHH